MFYRLLEALFMLSLSTSLIAGQIQGRITDDQGTGLKGVRVCLTLPDAAPGECIKTHFTKKNGDYSFANVDAATPHIVKVLTGASLKARKDDPYPNYAWQPVAHEVELAFKKDKIQGIDFTGSFNFSNFQAEFELSGADFPELAYYDLANDYVFLKVYAANPVDSDQNLIFIGRITDVNALLIEVSVPLSTTELVYEVYSASAPDLVVASISLSSSE